MMRTLLVSLGVWCCLAGTASAADPRPKFVPPFAKPTDVPVSGRDVVALRAFDALMTQFVAEHKLPGAQLAIGRNGNVFYSRGFGYADVDAKFPLQPEHRFRIASISKSITAVAVVKLAAEGRLRLDERIVDVLGTKFPFTANPTDLRLRQITIQHLLNHSAGWDRTESFDPMFRSPEICAELQCPAPAGPVDTMQYMWTRPLQFDPGTKYVYSNFGYCVLGRIIEAVSGLTYAEYVRLEVMAPIGVDRIVLGRTLEKDRESDEVHYYDDSPDRVAVMGPDIGKPVPEAHGAWCLETMDAHGGWLATAEDMVKFGLAYTATSRNPIRNDELVHKMFERPARPLWHDEKGQPEPYYYALGWLVKPVAGSPEWFNAWHNGALPGTSTILVHRYDGVCWAVFFNSRQATDDKRPAQLIDQPLHEVAKGITGWPR